MTIRECKQGNGKQKWNDARIQAQTCNVHHLARPNDNMSPLKFPHYAKQSKLAHRVLNVPDCGLRQPCFRR